MPRPSDSARLVQQDFLDLFDRVLDPAWVDAKKATPGGGYELLQGLAKVGERVSAEVERFERAGLATWADAAVQATGTVRFARKPGTPRPAFVLKSGTQVAASASGRRFVTTADVAFGLNDLGPYDAPVRSVDPGAAMNMPGLVTTAAGESLPGELDTLWYAVMQDPTTNAPVFDPSLSVFQLVPTTGGQDSDLERLGLDEGRPREFGEAEGAYRERLRALPDTVSPAAVRRSAVAALAPYGQVGVFEEPADPRLCPPPDAPGAVGMLADDPRDGAPGYPFANRLVDVTTDRGAFVIALVRFQPVTDYGLLLDDPAHTLAAHASPVGRRAVAAPDVPLSDPQVVAGAYLAATPDGYDAAAQAVYDALDRKLQAAKLGGVTALTMVKK